MGPSSPETTGPPGGPIEPSDCVGERGMDDIHPLDSSTRTFTRMYGGQWTNDNDNDDDGSGDRWFAANDGASVTGTGAMETRQETTGRQE